MISCVGHKRKQMPPLVCFCVSLLAITETDANNWMKANVRRGLFDQGQSAQLKCDRICIFFVPQLTCSHRRCDGCEHMTHSSLGRGSMGVGPMLASLLSLC